MEYVVDQELKTHPEPFQAVLDGTKHAEFRKDDREFGLGDVLLLNEWDIMRGYTGRSCAVRITHIQHGFGIPEDYVMLSIKRLVATQPEISPLVKCESQAAQPGERCHRIPSAVTHDSEEREFRRALLDELETVANYAAGAAIAHQGIDDLRQRFLS